MQLSVARRIIVLGVAISAIRLLALPIAAQTECQRPGPDIIIGDIVGVANYGTDAGYDAISIGHTWCNIGDAQIDFFASTNRHPVMAQGLCRLRTIDGASRFEQLGQSWLYHGFFALSNNLCCTCTPTDGTHLGVGCADPSTASRNGSQIGLGPKWQVNAATGVFSYPPASPPVIPVTGRRLRVALSDLEPSSPALLYFAESLVVSPDDAAVGNKGNNASYRKLTAVEGAPAQGYTFGISGATVREQPAIRAWRAIDPAVVESDIQIPNDGLLILAARSTDLGAGRWHYEYALYNMNSDRSGQSFSIPVPAGVRLMNIGFHDVDYHGGDGMGNINRDGTDWTATHGGCRLTWHTQTYAANPNGNALRWGTLYNFRFDANAAPMAGGGVATIGLFTPGTPAFVTSSLIPVPGSAGLIGDLNCDGAVNSFDIDPFVLALSEPAVFAMNYPACDILNSDLDGDGAVTNFDIDGMVQCLTSGICGCQ